jgi:hypothetical protein
MSFLWPLYLLGVLAVSLPVLFHLFRRTPRGRTEFSSLMFLTPSPPRLTRRSRLENLPLLLLRALILCLLALAFARPLWRQAAQAEVDASQGRWLAILVDTSASMRRADLWQQAQAKVDELLSDAGPLDRVALLAFDRRTQTLVDFEDWAQVPEGARAGLVRQRLADQSPGWAPTNLGAALVTAAEAIEQAESRLGRGRARQPRRIVLVSDLQQGSLLEALQAYEWPAAVEVQVEIIKPRESTNAALQLVQDDVPWQAEGQLGPRLRVTNAADSSAERFRIRWANATNPAADATAEVYVPPGQTRIVRGPPLAEGAQGSELVLEGDAHDFDNRLYVVPPQQQEVAVLYVGQESPADPKQLPFYLGPAFPETPWHAVRVLTRSPEEPPLPGEAAPQLVVVADTIPEDRSGWLRRYLEGGGTALVVLQSSDMAAFVGRLLGREVLSASEASGRDYAMLSQIDFSHPLFAPLADPRFSDFTKIHFWRHRKLDEKQLPGSRVLARFDDGDPALVEAGVGSGRLLVLTSGWHPADSQLALSSKFVPLMHGLLDQDHARSVQQVEVGAAVELRPASPDGSVTVHPPGSGARERPVSQAPANASSAAPSLAQGLVFSATDRPGIYTVEGAAGLDRFAVNVPAAESKTAPLAIEELEQLGVRLAGHQRSISPEQAAAERRQLLAVELEGRQKLWRWLIAAALGGLVLEIWMAGRASRRAVA